MQDNRMIVVLVLALASSGPALLRAASLESSRADLAEPLQQQESAEVANQLEATAEGELDEGLADEGSPLQDQKWAEEGERAAGGQPDGDQDSQDSNIAGARVELGRQDLAAAAGYHHHHHHHGHQVHGKMSMGAHSGHKGAFGWHAKFPVGGKGRR